MLSPHSCPHFPHGAGRLRIVRRVGHVAPGPAAVPRGVIQGIPRRIRRTGGNSADVPQLGARVGQALSEL